MIGDVDYNYSFSISDDTLFDVGLAGATRLQVNKEVGIQVWMWAKLTFMGIWLEGEAELSTSGGIKYARIEGYGKLGDEDMLDACPICPVFEGSFLAEKTRDNVVNLKMEIDMQWLGLKFYGYSSLSSNRGIKGFAITADGSAIATTLLASVVQVFTGKTEEEQRGMDNAFVKFLYGLFDGIKLPKFWLTYGDQQSDFGQEKDGLEIGFEIGLPIINHPLTMSFYSDKALYNIPGLMLDFLQQMSISKLLVALAPLDYDTKGGIPSGIRTYAAQTLLTL